MMRRVVGLAFASALAACNQGSGAGGGGAARAGAGTHYALGRAATDSEVKAWDIDVNPSGAGLPAGRGTYASGVAVYAKQCSACHGAKGEGLPPNPRLVGPEPRDFSFATDTKATKTIGNYWPYATTLYDYIRRAMPMTSPGSLSNNEVYSLTAYLLAQNEVVPKDAVLDAESLRRVRMPARDRFVKDDRKGGAEVR